nr:uncharacterized PE-PGRS family protein PE_PGRS54-like [Aegilops tauschii subsp. strangulata]
MGNDVDMHEGDDSAGAEGAPTDESTREGANGSRPVAQSGDGTGVELAPSPSVPMTSLRFGSFEPASAPPRLWSDRVDSDDVFEYSLPLLEFEDAGEALAGCLARTSSVRTLAGSGDGEPVVASPEVEVPEITVVAEVGRGGGGSGQVASTSLFTIPTSASLVMAGSAGAGRGGPRQAASALSPSGVAAATAPSEALGEGGLGQVALTPPSSSVVRRTASPSVVAAPASSETSGEGGFGAGGPDSSFLVGGKEDCVSSGRGGGTRAFRDAGGGGFGAGGPGSSSLFGGQEDRVSCDDDDPFFAEGWGGRRARAGGPRHPPSQRTRCYGSRLGALVRGVWEPAAASSGNLG